MTLQKTKSAAYDSAFLRQPNHQHLYTVLPEPTPNTQQDIRTREECNAFHLAIA